MTNTIELDYRELVGTYYEASDELREEILQQIKKHIALKKGYLLAMQTIVEKKLKSYKTDFYLHDVQRLTIFEGDSQIWILRDSGTQLLNLDWDSSDEYGNSTNLQSFDSFMRHTKVNGIYHVSPSENTVKKISKDRARALIDGSEKWGGR